MQPKKPTFRPVTTAWIVRNFNIPASTIKLHAANGYLPAFREPETPKLWEFWPEDVKSYVTRRMYAIAAR